MMCRDDGIRLGGTPQHEEFRKRNARFVDEFLPPLGHLLESIARSRKRLDRDGRVIYALGRLVSEDFTEVVVNCANSLTTGAMKIQRGM